MKRKRGRDEDTLGVRNCVTEKRLRPGSSSHQRE